MKLRRPRRFAAAMLLGAFVGGSVAYVLRRVPARDVAPEAELGEVRLGRFEDADLERPQVPARLIPVAAGVGQPTDIAFVPGHPSKLVVTSKWGSLHLVDLATETRVTWLWLPVLDALESGVLGLAFAPDFTESGRFFVHQTPRSEDDSVVTSALTELRVDPQTLAEPRVVGELLRIPQPHGTHNAGQLAFGPDGMLFMALGDGYAGRPARRSQDRTNLLGSLVRVDVSTSGRYTVPPDNPFVGQEGVRPEIWAYGFRNPWRFTFDGRGRAIVADVGAARWEEVAVVRAGDNHGWPDREGFVCHPPETCTDAPDEPEPGDEDEGAPSAVEGVAAREGSTDAPGNAAAPPAGPSSDFADPVLVYDHRDGISITGGVEWQAPGPLEGAYIFGDFGTGRIWAARLPEPPARVEELTALGRFDVSPSAFARDAEGRVFLTDFRMERVYRIDLAL